MKQRWSRNLNDEVWFMGIEVEEEAQTIPMFTASMTPTPATKPTTPESAMVAFDDP